MASDALISGDVSLLESNLSLFSISAAISFISIFLSLAINSLYRLSALIFTLAVKNILSSALGNTTVPISLPSKILLFSLAIFLWRLTSFSLT